MRFQAQPLLETFFRVHRFHRWLTFSLPPRWENYQLEKLEGRFRERITTLLSIMSLFYHLILPKQIEMASLLFIQSELQFILEKKMARKGEGGKGRLLIFHFLFCFLKPKSMGIFSLDCFNGHCNQVIW